MSDRAEVAAALERWEKRAEYLRAFSSDPMSKAADAGDELARLLRESQETPGERLKRMADETDEADFENERTDYE